MPKKGKGKSLIVSPLSPEAQNYLHEVEKRRVETLTRISKIPIASLIWGPSPTDRSLVSKTRMQLREKLITLGHLVHFSEELMDRSLPFSIQAQQVSHAESHDIVFSIPDSPGSIAEIHDFAKIPGLSHKIVTFLDRQWNAGYANRSLIEIQSTATCDIVLYDDAKLPDCIIDKACGLVVRLQELYYMFGRRR